LFPQETERAAEAKIIAAAMVFDGGCKSLSLFSFSIDSKL
jgi:hypothetical protein